MIQDIVFGRVGFSLIQKAAEEAARKRRDDEVDRIWVARRGKPA